MSLMPRFHRVTVGAAATAVLALIAACTGSTSGGANDDPTEETTILFWHGWSAPSEVAAIKATIDAFEQEYPNIHVEAVGNITDDKINQALRAGGSNAPDVVSSFTTDNVGEFCSSHVFADLAPFFEKSDIDPEKVFPAALLDYTQYEGNQCSLPLLSDAYGLYYNKDAFEAAGISRPPKTLSEFEADAVKLTKPDGDSFSQLGFMPNFHGYETSMSHLAALWGPTYFDAEGNSNAADDPALTAMFTWQKGMVETLGGYAKLEKYRSTFGDEWSARNPFMTGQVAMAMDGEWRAGMIDDAGIDLNYGVAPFPVPDDQADTYGKGYITGTIVGIANTSEKQNAAWEFVKYLTTDTEAVVNFSNAIHNVPSTTAALQSPDVDQDPDFTTFIDIAMNPDSNTTPSSPNGGAYQLTLQDVGYDYEAGRVTDLQAALAAADEQIDADIAQAQ
jgi:multiple sugar transport system substrate-binding protein